MFDELRKKLFFARFQVLGAKASQEGKIMEFDEEIYEKMKNTIIACFPVSFYIKHSKHMFPIGTCYDRSLYMFLALGDDAVLCRGNNKDLEYNWGYNPEQYFVPNGWYSKRNNKNGRSCDLP